MVHLPDKFYEDIDRLKNHKILKINQSDWKTLEVCKERIRVNDNPNQKYVFHYNHETISNTNYLDSIYKLIDDFEIDAVILTATSSTFPRSTHPLTNLLMWRDVDIRNTISWYSKINKPIFSNNFYYGKLLDGNRLHKGILSVRKETVFRNQFFKQNPKLESGIVRYAKWPDQHDDLVEDNIKINEFPTMDELLDDYSNSYFSFILESEGGDIMNSLTEKTLVAILTGTMPIVLGGKGFISELKDMGIKVWNKEFGFEDGDLYHTYSHQKQKYLLRCIENVNKLSLTDAKNYWYQNQDLIQKNYDLISYILFEEKFKYNLIFK